jgi:hypothetical protein
VLICDKKIDLNYDIDVILYDVDLPDNNVEMFTVRKLRTIFSKNYRGFSP